MNRKELKSKDIKGIYIGHAQDHEALTGCTVILCPEGAVTGVDVRGGGPASRETELLKTEKMVKKIHGVVLSGGSAYGLSASDGVMKYLEERNIGFDVGVGVVPIVVGASLFDLVIGDSKVRPDSKMGYLACENSQENNDSDEFGNIGAGTGATVGKYLGTQYMMKGGLGVFGIEIDGIQCFAIVAVNALGDIIDYDSGQIIAGLLDEDKINFRNTEKVMLENISKEKNLFASSDKDNVDNITNSNMVTNTTIGCIITNAKLTKSEANRLATITHNAFAKVINPVHTSADGDTIFVMSTGEKSVNVDSLGILSVEVMAKAINSCFK